MPYRVLIVDRRILFATGLARLLSSRPAISQAQTLLDRSSLTAVLRDPWDVVLVDTHSVEEVLASHRPGTRVVLLLEAQDEALAATMLSRGASGICAPEDSAEDLAETIERVAAGEMRVPLGQVGRVLELLMAAGDRASQISQELGQLTPREVDVLTLLGAGLGRAEIACETGLSQNTVRTHIQHLLRKLSLHSQLEAAAYAREVLPTAEIGPTSDARRADNVLDIDTRTRRPDLSRRR